MAGDRETSRTAGQRVKSIWAGKSEAAAPRRRRLAARPPLPPLIRNGDISDRI